MSGAVIGMADHIERRQKHGQARDREQDRMRPVAATCLLVHGRQHSPTCRTLILRPKVQLYYALS